ncbi:MAG: type II toxin-antitoxin system RelE/ParE family toxin, partial [Legionellales bacterium]
HQGYALHQKPKLGLKLVILRAPTQAFHIIFCPVRRKKLQGESYFRLRVGQWRVIFDRTDELKIISIEKIKSRGDVYK